MYVAQTGCMTCRRSAVWVFASACLAVRRTRTGQEKKRGTTACGTAVPKCAMLVKQPASWLVLASSCRVRTSPPAPLAC